MKLSETKSLLKDLRALSAEELTAREAELKKELEALPDDAECFFTLWTSNGRQMYWFNPTFGTKVYDGVNNKFAQIAYADDCLAYRVFEANTSEGNRILLHRVGEKVSPEEPKKEEEEKWYSNHYTCPQCGATWNDEWTATCDDECPECGCISSPDYSVDL